MRTGTEIRRSRARLSEQRKKTGNYEQNDRLKWYYHSRKLIMLSNFIILCKTSRKMILESVELAAADMGWQQCLRLTNARQKSY
jgi:hypothetical protein